MKKIAILFFSLFLFYSNGQIRKIPVDTIVVTNHTTKIKNQVIKYQEIVQNKIINKNETGGYICQENIYKLILAFDFKIS